MTRHSVPSLTSKVSISHRIRKIAIIKLGSTMPTLAAERGDFEGWILQGMNLNTDAVAIIDPRSGATLPSMETLSGVIVTGSHAMVTDRLPWSERTAEWLRSAFGDGLPILGICYGHQLLAYALGGDVADNPNGKEFGTVPAYLTAVARTDRLLRELGPIIKVQTSHTQSVIVLPVGARVLATSELDPHLAFVVGNRAWGVQFHPEFSAEVVRAYTEATRATLQAEGQDPDAILATIEEAPVGTTILRRFAEVVLEHGVVETTARMVRPDVMAAQMPEIPDGVYS